MGCGVIGQQWQWRGGVGWGVGRSAQMPHSLVFFFLAMGSGVLLICAIMSSSLPTLDVSSLASEFVSLKNSVISNGNLCSKHIHAQTPIHIHNNAPR